MAQRKPFHAPQMPTSDHDQLWNHPHPDSHLHSGNGSFMLPMDGAANIAAVLRPNDYPSSSSSNYIATNPGPLHEPYLHPSSTASSSWFPPDQVLCVPPTGFSQHGWSMVNTQTEFGRAAFKRKSPSMAPAFSGGNGSGCYNAGSSSNPHISSSSLQPKPITGPQHWPWPLDPASNSHCYRIENLLTAGEDSQRNVRSRHNHTLHTEINPSVTYSSSNLPRHFYAAGNLSAHSMEGQLSHVPMSIAFQGRDLSSDPGFNYDENQSLAGPRVVNNTAGANGIFHPNLSRNTSFLPTLHDHLTRSAGAGSNGYIQRSNPHRSSSSYTPVGFTAASLDWGCRPSGTESVALSRYSRPLSITGRNSYRNGRARGSYSRFQSSYDEDIARSRWFSEGAVMMDRAAYHDSRNWFDQHRDMGLDIDNMSYEELLALEERIGNVSTGLSEETISRCLQEITHCSSIQFKDDQEDGKCVICLEEYKDQDKLGRLSCRHDFHAGCIKNWLLIKNACPICRAPASTDTLKEKQTQVPV